MNSSTLRTRLLTTLLTLERKTQGGAVCARLLAGFALLLRLLPPLPRSPAPTWAVPAGALLLIFGLAVMAGPVLNAAQPIFVKLGALPGWTWVAAVVVVTLGQRYRAGQQYLQASAELMR